jgi:hypothetical protein
VSNRAANAACRGCPTAYVVSVGGIGQRCWAAAVSTGPSTMLQRPINVPSSSRALDDAQPAGVLGSYDLPYAVAFQSSVGPRELDGVFPTICLGVSRTFTAIQNGHGIAKEVHLDFEEIRLGRCRESRPLESSSESRCAYWYGSGRKMSFAHRRCILVEHSINGAECEPRAGQSKWR